MNKPRKWWLAGLLSILQPGIGQLYAGSTLPAILFFVSAFIFVGLVILALYFSFPPQIIVVFYGLFFIMHFYTILHAMLIAYKCRTTYTIKKYNRTWLYIVLIIGVRLLDVATATYCKAHLFEDYKRASESMTPTILSGDWIVVDKRKPLNIKRGDLLAYEDQKGTTKAYIKRVVAIPNDTIEIKNKKLYINGQQLEEPYIQHIDLNTFNPSDSPRDFLAKTTILPGQCFLLGDNRDNSIDSRFFGALPENNILGKALVIYWHWDKQTHIIRWTRIGKMFKI